MELFAIQQIRSLLSKPGLRNAPHVSIYLPLGNRSEDRERGRDRLFHLINRSETMLYRYYPNLKKSFTQPIKDLADSLGKMDPSQGIAVFYSGEVAAYILLNQKPSELAVVAESFHLKPILPSAQKHDCYFLLSLDYARVKLFEGFDSGIHQLEVFRATPGFGGMTAVTYGARHRAKTQESDNPLNVVQSMEEISAFYRRVDERMRRIIGKKHMPLIVAGSHEMLRLYARISRNRILTLERTETDADPVDGLERLHEKSWELAWEFIKSRQQRYNRIVQASRLKGRVAEKLEDIARAAEQGLVDTLFLDADAKVWGRIEAGGVLRFRRGQEDFAADDLLDDIAERVLSREGKVHVVKAADMPAKAVAVALLR